MSDEWRRDGRYRARFDSVDYSVGWLAALTVLIVTLMVVQTGRVQGWLEDWSTFQVRLPSQGTYGLREGAEVRMRGIRVGRVVAVDIDPDDVEDITVFATVQLRPEFARRIRDDAKVIVQQAFVVAGDAFLEIEPGTGEPIAITSGTVLAAEENDELAEQLGVILEDVQRRVPETLDQINRTLAAVAEITERLADEQGDLNRMIVNARRLSDAAADPRGPVQFLLRNIDLTKSLEEALAETAVLVENVNAIAVEARGATGEVGPLLAEVRRTVAEARETIKVLRESDDVSATLSSTRETAEALPALLFQLEQTMLQVERLTRDLQASWLVGGNPTPRVPEAAPAEGLP